MSVSTSTLRIECLGRNRDGRLHLRAYSDATLIHEDAIDLTRDFVRRRFINRLGEKAGEIDEKAIERQLLEINAKSRRERAPDNEGANPPKTVPSEIKHEALEMLRARDLMSQLSRDITALGITGEETLAQTIYLIGTSRLLERPLAGIVTGLSSSGKSFLVSRIADLFPPDAVLLVHQITPQALYYLKPGSLVHKFVVAGEKSRRQDDEVADATKALREMISDGKLTKLVTDRDEQGALRTKYIQQDGPIAFIETTTLTKLFDEDRNRCLILATDESEHQTRRIIADAGKRRGGESRKTDIERLKLVHRTLQGMLRPVKVNIPFASRLGEMFPTRGPESRRRFEQVLSMVEAVTLLHQFQRCEDPTKATIIEATREDYAVARELLAGPFAASGRVISRATSQFLERLKGWFSPGQPFTGRNVQAHEEIIHDPSTIRQHLRSLADAGFVEELEPGIGTIPSSYAIVENPPTDRGCILPEIEALS